MIHSKNNTVFLSKKQAQPGFSLIEVIIALAIMATLLAPLFLTQSTVIRSVGYYARDTERMLHAKNFLLESRRKLAENGQTGEVVLEKKVARPETILQYSFKKIQDGSVLKKFEDLYIEQVQIEYQDGNTKRTDSLVTYVYQPAKKQSHE